MSKILEEMDVCEKKAIDSLSRYKFYMFGYWSAAWIKYNQLAVDMGVIEKKRPNPFKFLVDAAKEKKEIE